MGDHFSQVVTGHEISSEMHRHGLTVSEKAAPAI